MARRLLPSITLVSAVLVLAGCSLPFGIASTGPTPHPGRSADPHAMAAREALRPDPNFDFGQTIQIAPEAFHPAVLVSLCCQVITWKNMTGAPVTVVIDRLNVNSGPIAPGGTFLYTPANMQSMTYHLDGHPDIHGAIQVNQTFESLTICPPAGGGQGGGPVYRPVTHCPASV